MPFSDVDNDNELFCETAKPQKCVNPCVPNAPFLYPLKTPENRKVF